MDSLLDAVLEALKIHGPIGAVFLAIGIIGRERFKQDDQRHKENDHRLADLENDRVTTHDLERVFDRIEGVSQQLQQNQNAILNALAQHKPR